MKALNPLGWDFRPLTFDDDGDVGVLHVHDVALLLQIDVDENDERVMQTDDGGGLMGIEVRSDRNQGVIGFHCFHFDHRHHPPDLDCWN